MDVSCPQCKTLYELDDRQLDDDGEATLKCSQCGQLFRLQSTGVVEDEQRRRWMVRQSDTGDILYFSGFDRLHEWIVDGEIDADDAISRTGHSWKRLGEIGEFTPIFQVMESIADISTSSSEQVTRKRETTASSPSAPADIGEQTTADESSSPSRSQSPSTGGQPQSPLPTSGPESPSPKSEQAGSEPEHSPDDERRQGVQLEEGRFETKDQQPAASSDEEQAPKSEPTFGELEYQTEPSFDDYEVGRRRRWPWVVAVVVVLGAAGIWQYETLQDWAGDLSHQFGDTPDTGVVETSDERVATAIDEVSEWVEESIYKGQRRQRSAAIGPAVEQSRQLVAEATEKAAQEAEDSVDVGPSSVGEFIAAGSRSRNRGDIEQAIQRYEHALEMSPGNAEALIGLGWTHLSADRIGEAVDKFETARRNDPTASEALIGLGRAERSRDRQRAALEAYEEYLERFPGGNQASIAEYQSEQLRQALQD